MTVSETPLEDVLLLKPTVFNDERGYFYETFNEKILRPYISASWVQENESKSVMGVLRGLHYQFGEMAQAKMVRAVLGTIYDVIVDLRPASASYKKWYGIQLSSENKYQLYIPRGFAHGFMVLSEEAIFSYKCDNFYSKDHEAGIRYNDPDIQVNWPKIDCEVILSEKDKLQPFISYAIPFDKF